MLKMENNNDDEELIIFHLWNLFSEVKAFTEQIHVCNNHLFSYVEWL